MEQNQDHQHGVETIPTIPTDKVIARLREEGLPSQKIKHVEKMLRLSFDPSSSGWLIEQGLGTLQALKEQRDHVLDRVAKHIQQHNDLARAVGVLLSVRGIDIVSAATIIAELGEPSRFRDGKAVSSYFGIVPSVNQSGPKTVLGRITKRGSPHMWRILCQVAQVVSRDGAAPLRRWFAQIKIRRGTQKAMVALARKILVISWAMLRDNNPFQDPGKPIRSDGLYQRKLRTLKKKAQRSTKTVSVWEALHLLATDHKLRAELGLTRIVTTTPSTPTRKAPI